mgnify:CR=1 FL=1
MKVCIYIVKCSRVFVWHIYYFVLEGITCSTNIIEKYNIAPNYIVRPRMLIDRMGCVDGLYNGQDLLSMEIDGTKVYTISDQADKDKGLYWFGPSKRVIILSVYMD